MLDNTEPSEAIINWAEETKLVKLAKDRPWYHAAPPIFATEAYQPPCHCHTSVKISRYACEDNNGYVYLGQCAHCQAIIWSFLECSGK